MGKNEKQTAREHNEEFFTRQELAIGKSHGYHLITCQHPLACYAPDHPEDKRTWVPLSKQAPTVEECDRIIWENIKSLIRERSTQKHVADGFKIDVSTLRKRLQKPSELDNENVARLCKVLGVNVEQLISRKHADPYDGAPLPADRLASLYAGLSERHRSMITDLVHELMESELAREGFAHYRSGYVDAMRAITSTPQYRELMENADPNEV